MQLNTHDGGKMYDVIIIGSGPAGICAGIYSAIYKLNALVIGEKPGGYATDAFQIKNYPGIPDVKGLDLMAKFETHINKLGVKPKTESVERITKDKKSFEVTTDKNKYQSKSIIIATGTERRKLNIPGEKELMGKGVAFCATCDAFFFKDKITAVIGGSDSALTSALQLAEYAKKVYIIFRKDTPTAIPTWIEKVKSNPKIVLVPKANLTKIIGKEKVEQIVLDNKFNNSDTLQVDGVFIEIGTTPLVELLSHLKVELDDKNFIKVNHAQATNIDGVFAAGDATTGSNKFQQIITAASEGAIAANSTFKYIKSKLITK
jgi:thioredoxin reductase (NADPH)